MQHASASRLVDGGGSSTPQLGSSRACPYRQLPSSRQQKLHRCKHLLAAAAAAAAAPDAQPQQTAATAVLGPAKQPLIRLSRRKRPLSWQRWERKLFETLLAVDQEQVRQTALQPYASLAQTRHVWVRRADGCCCCAGADSIGWR
jgi:hypothetical protein